MKEKKKCFVISPIGSENSTVRTHADNVLNLIIQPAMASFDMLVLRADQLDKPGKITNQMFDEIFRSDLCIAILTGHNPNVFYELAIAQSINKPLIILISEKEELPFDIKDLRCIFYDVESNSFEPVKNKLVSYVKSFEKENWIVEDIFDSSRRFSESFVNPEITKANRELRNFCTRVKGYWLSSGVELGSTSLGIVEFTADELTNTLSLIGRAYNLEGQLIATWHTRASCINMKEKQLHYYWEGEHSKKSGDRFEGFGEITFFDSATDLFLSGKGTFFDKNLSDIKSATMKRSDLRRCTEEQVLGIRGENSREWFASLVKKETARM